MAQYGYLSTYKPQAAPRITTSPLSLAAGTTTASNPFGFQVAKNTTGYAEAPAAAPHAPPAPRYVATPPPQKALVAAPGLAAAAATPIPKTQAYDINTDPSLQATNSLAGMGDEQATAGALKAKQQTLLNYGDPNLIRSVLGDENLATAAGASPTSTLASLGQQRDRNSHQLTEGLNQNNLLYSGYRVTQEQQAGQDYQNALATAAANVNGGLDTINGNLASVLAGNQASRIAAEQAARDRAVQSAIANGTGGGTDTLAGAASGAPHAGPPLAGDGQPFLPPGVTKNAPIAGQQGATLSYGGGSAAPSSLFPPGYNLTYGGGGNAPIAGPEDSMLSYASPLAKAARAKQTAYRSL